MTSINSNSEAAQSTTLAKQQAHARRLALDEQRFAFEKDELVLKRKAASRREKMDREHQQLERKREKRMAKAQRDNTKLIANGMDVFSRALLAGMAMFAAPDAKSRTQALKMVTGQMQPRQDDDDDDDEDVDEVEVWDEDENEDEDEDENENE